MAGDSHLGIVLTARDQASGVVKGLRAQFAGFKQDAMTGFGLGAGIGVFNLAERAISGVVNAGFDMVNAAIDEEKNIVKLNAALKANVEGWNGNTDAIEATIAAREKLAFSDDHQRDSIAQLVAVTHDENKALDLSREAMDLARLKNMDLVTASQVLGKVYAGNVSILSRYGIQLAKGTSATGALAAIQKMSAGQAEAFASTTEGSMDSMRIAIQDAQEEIGQKLLPVFKDLAIWVRDTAVPALLSFVDALGNIGNAFNNINRFLDPSTAAMQDQLAVVDKVAAAYGMSATALEDLVKQQHAAATQVDVTIADWISMGNTIDTYTGHMKDAATTTQTTTADITEGWRHAARVIVESANLSVDAVNFMSPEMFSAANEVFRNIPQAASKASKATVTIMSDLPPSIHKTLEDGRAEVKAAMADIRYDIEHPMDQAQYAAFLKAKLASRKIREGLRSNQPAIKEETRAFVAWIKDKLAELGSIGVSIDYSIPRPTRNQRLTQHRAGGGPVSANQTYTVGEHGPETLVMGDQGGTVIPHGGGGRMVADVYLDSQKVGKVLWSAAGRQLAYSTSPSNRF